MGRTKTLESVRELVDDLEIMSHNLESLEYSKNMGLREFYAPYEGIANKAK